jgi:YidC/Oxa1 family membrane protein insertase
MTRNPLHKGPEPGEIRNILLFAVVALAFYWAWDVYVLAPRRAVAEQAVQEAVQPAVPAPEPISREEALAASARVPFRNGAVEGSISLTGGTVDDLSLARYAQTLEGGEPVTLLSPRGTAFDRALSWGWVGDGVALPDADTTWTAPQGAVLTPASPVTLTWDNGAGLIFRRTIALDEYITAPKSDDADMHTTHDQGESSGFTLSWVWDFLGLFAPRKVQNRYVFTVTQEVENRGTEPVTLHPFARVAQSGVPPGSTDSWIQHEGPLGFVGGKLVEENYGTVAEASAWTQEAAEGWVGITDKYWLTALIPPQGEATGFAFRHAGGRYQADTIGQAVTVEPGATAAYTAHAFAGAKEVTLLDAYTNSIPAPKLDLAVNFGWFWFLAKPFFYLLHGLYTLAGNFGVAIILMTLIVRGAAFPLTNTAYRSMAHMKQVAPQILALQKRYKDDRAALQAEIMKIYEKEGVNPMAGCMPILVQIPIFFALYKVLYVTIEMRHAPFFGWLQDLSAPDPTSIFNLFGLIPWDPPSLLQIGVLPLIMLAALIVQKNLNPPPQDALQRDLQNYFPFIMVFMLAHFPAGLVLYWAFSSIFTVAQQIVIMRNMGMEIHLFSKSKAEEALEENLGHIGHIGEEKNKK